MKTFSAVAAATLALAATVFASPSPTEKLAPRAPSENLAPRASASLTPVTVQGNAFFNGTTRFYIRGIDWQPNGSSNLTDPLADSTACKRDIAEFVKLGLNTVRVYTVDNSVNHDDCMSQLAAAGIYLILDVNSPNYSLNRADPAPSYNAVYLQNVFATIDAFAGYSNTLAFFSGNEVINNDFTTSAAPYVKAVTRDMRQYLGSRNYRQVPCGYSAADVPDNRLEMAEYMNCGTDDERSDFFAFNDYSWCDPTTFTGSGWDQKVKNFTDYGIPIFLSETGCIVPGPRTWGELAAVYNTEMTGVYSGMLAYEYSEEVSGFGMVNIESETSVSELSQFGVFQKALAAAPPPSGDGGYNKTGGSSTCPPTSSTWNVTNDALPAIPSAAAAYMTNGAGPGVGLNGKGSQNAGGTSTGTAVPGSGSVTAVASGTSAGTAAATSSKGAAAGPVKPFDQTPLVVTGLMLVFTMLGATLL